MTAPSLADLEAAITHIDEAMRHAKLAADHCSGHPHNVPILRVARQSMNGARLSCMDQLESAMSESAT